MGHHIHVDPFGGLSGEMLLAALLGLGAPPAEIEAALSALAGSGLEGTRIEGHRLERFGAPGTVLEVHGPVSHSRPPSLARLRQALLEAPLPAPPRSAALRALEALAGASGTGGTAGDAPPGLPDEPPGERVALLAVPVGLHLLGVDRISCGPLPLPGARLAAPPGAGASPILTPGPAVLELLRGLPTAGAQGRSVPLTACGLALARALAFSFAPSPPMTLEATATAFPSQAEDHLWGLRLSLGRTDSTQPLCREPLVVLEANLDDLSGELLATLVDACLEAGALDAWLVPVLMKKGRPAQVLSALCRPAQSASVEEAMFRHSSTLGVRKTRVERDALARSWEEVETPWGRVRVKVGRQGRKVVNRAPEFEDCLRIARASGTPIKEVYAAALAATLSR
ncbi:MAG: hypothetical protein Kow0092_10680 [Deferrisomatales bacterium]